MPRSTPRRGRTRFTVLVAITAAITLLSFDSRGVPVLGAVRSGALQALAPIEDFFGRVGTPFRNAWKGITGYGDLERENEALRVDLDKLRARADESQALSDEVAKLQEQLDLKQKLEFPSVVARVATGNFSSFDDNTAQIDRGSESGIRVGNPVVTNRGLVGRVIRVSTSRAVVQLITDRDLRVGIRTAGDAIGVGHGNGVGRPFLVDSQLTLQAAVEKDELIRTSGLNRDLFPAGLEIGSVRRVTRSQADQTLVLEVRLFADLGRLDYVQVLDWVPQE